MRTAAQWGVWVADIDTEGDLDVVVSPADGPAVVLRNNGDGTFTAQTAVWRDRRTCAAFAWLDLDNDLVPDAVVGRRRRHAAGLPEPPGRAVPRSAGGRRRTGTAPGFRFTEAAGRGRFGADLDNNGATDLVTVDADDDRDPARSGRRARRPPPGTLELRAGAAADLDGDGRLDLVGVDKGGTAVVAKNRGTKAYHYQIVRPKSATVLGDQRINSFGIGGQVEVRTGLHVQRTLITSPIVHIGLGEADARRGRPDLLAQRHHPVRVRV